MLRVCAQHLPKVLALANIKSYSHATVHRCNDKFLFILGFNFFARCIKCEQLFLYRAWALSYTLVCTAFPWTALWFIIRINMSSNIFKGVEKVLIKPLVQSICRLDKLQEIDVEGVDPTNRLSFDAPSAAGEDIPREFEDRCYLPMTDACNLL